MKRLMVMGAIMFSLATLFTSCNKTIKEGDIVIVMKQAKGQPLAQVGKTVLSLESMRDDFLERQGQFRGAPNLNSEQARSNYMETQVLQKAMFFDAIEQGYFGRLDVIRDVEKIVVQKLMRDKLEKAQNDFVPSEEQIKQHYEKNQNLYNRSEAVKVAFVSIPFGSKKDKAKEIAMIIHKDALENVKNGNGKIFSRLAAKHAEKFSALGAVSVETNETDYLEKEACGAKFGPDLFSQLGAVEAIGKIPPLVTTDNAFVIAMKSGYRKALNETLEQAQPKIVKRLSYESRGDVYKQYTEELRKKYDIKIFSERVAELSKDPIPLANKKDGGDQAPINPAIRDAQAKIQTPPPQPLPEGEVEAEQQK